jgi:hypothetical protein
VPGKAGRSFSACYSTASESLARQVQLLLAQLGYPARLVYAPPKDTIIRGKQTHSNGCWMLRVGQPYSSELADLVWEGVSQSKLYPTQAREGWSSTRPECMRDDDFIYVPVKSVARHENTLRVYNLTVSGDHSYLANGLATYNSNQGNVFVIEHAPKLEAFANKLWTYLDKLVPQMKLQYVNTGSLHIEAGPNFRLAALLAASPTGGLFRNTFVAGGGGL